MPTFTKFVFLALCIIALPVNAITLSATPIKPLVVYKPPAVPPSGFNTSILSGVGPVLLQAAAGFRSGLTPFNVGLTAAGVVVGAPLMYGMMQGLQELQMQAGGLQSSHTAPASTTSTDSAYSLGECDNKASAVHTSTLEECKPVSAGHTFTWQWRADWNAYQLYDNGTGNAGNWHVTSPGCPSGYTYQGGNCTITDLNAVKYPSDGKPSYIISGGQFVPDPRDPDPVTDAPVLPIDRQGTDDYGNPVHESLKPTPDGGAEYRRDTETRDSQTGVPQVSRDIITTNNFGNVTGIYNQQIPNATADAVANASAVANVDTSSLNKEATQIEIKNFLDPGAKPDLTNVDQDVKTATDAVKADLEGSGTNVANNPAATLSIPTYWTYASGTCYPVTWDAGRFGVISLEKFCNIYDTHIRSMLVLLLGVLGILHAFGYWSEIVREV